jgi:hypothetical protein
VSYGLILHACNMWISGTRSVRGRTDGSNQPSDRLTFAQLLSPSGSRLNELAELHAPTPLALYSAMLALRIEAPEPRSVDALAAHLPGSLRC